MKKYTYQEVQQMNRKERRKIAKFNKIDMVRGTTVPIKNK